MKKVMTGGRRTGKTTLLSKATQVSEGTTHYDVLGVPPNAQTDQIKAAHRELARLFHPDLCALDNAHDLMSRVNQAYACLTDKDARRLYDTLNKTEATRCQTCDGKGFTHKQQGFMKKLRVPCYDCGGSGQC